MSSNPSDDFEMAGQVSYAKFAELILVRDESLNKRVKGAISRAHGALKRKPSSPTRHAPLKPCLSSTSLSSASSQSSTCGEDLIIPPHFESRLERLLTAYLNLHDLTETQSSLVSLCIPFVVCISDDYDAFCCFNTLMRMRDELSLCSDWNSRLSHFMMLCRVLLPDLVSHLQQEEIGFNSWASSWLQYFLSVEVPLDSLMRLWDTYFSDGIELHVYVCLSILLTMRENLEELEGSELVGCLKRLPHLDMDQIVTQAQRLRDELRDL